MNRRTFIQAAAPLAATASQSELRMKFHRAVRTSPIEVDLTDPDAARYVKNSETDLCARLEELHPGDEGQLSGISLRILQSGKYTILNAETPAPQQLGSSLSHSFGYLAGAELASVGAAEPTSADGRFFVRLRELYPQIRPESYSGVSLILFAGENPELRVCFGSHCLGVLKGRLLTTFLDCVRQRCEMETA